MLFEKGPKGPFFCPAKEKAERGEGWWFLMVWILPVKEVVFDIMCIDVCGVWYKKVS